MIKIKKGLDLPILGSPKQLIEKGKPIKKVAILGRDYWHLKPSLKVRVGEMVKIGQVLLEDKNNPGVLFTAPASGKILEVNLGKEQNLISIVIGVEDETHVSFKSFKNKPLAELSTFEIHQLLLESGEWCAFRTRPFSKIPKINDRPDALFVTATDTNPLAANPDIIINEKKDLFTKGMQVLAALLSCDIYLCTSEKQKWNFTEKNINQKKFKGPHPAGNVGTHIHHLFPVGANKIVWHIGYQDVIALGNLILNGKIYLPRVISLAGPQVKVPRLLNTQRGVNLLELTAGELATGTNRIVSGSILNGKVSQAADDSYLSRYHNQVSVIREESTRDFLGWYNLGKDKYSASPVFLSKLIPLKTFSFTSNSFGKQNPLFPLGFFEKILPMDIEPTFLFKNLLVGNYIEAAELGCLELDEEDLALCTFIDPSKNDFGLLLRQALDFLEKGAK